MNGGAFILSWAMRTSTVRLSAYADITNFLFLARGHLHFEHCGLPLQLPTRSLQRPSSLHASHLEPPPPGSPPPTTPPSDGVSTDWGWMTRRWQIDDPDPESEPVLDPSTSTQSPVALAGIGTNMPLVEGLACHMVNDLGSWPIMR